MWPSLLRFGGVSLRPRRRQKVVVAEPPDDHPAYLGREALLVEYEELLDDTHYSKIKWQQNGSVYAFGRSHLFKNGASMSDEILSLSDTEVRLSVRLAIRAGLMTRFFHCGDSIRSMKGG